MPVEAPMTESRRLELAYLRVFGEPRSRSGDQKRVWDDIESFCYAHRLVTEKTTMNAIDPQSPHFFDGRRSVWLRMRGQIILAQQEMPPPVKISRKKPEAK